MRPLESRRSLLLVAADWRSRTYTLAELEESGYDVMAVPGIRFAAQAISRGLVRPTLLILDTHQDDDATPAVVERLLDRVPGVPVILLVGAYGRDQWEPIRPRLSALLSRPLSIQQITTTVRRVWAP